MQYKTCKHSRNRKLTSKKGLLEAGYVKPGCPERHVIGKRYMAYLIDCEGCVHYKEAAHARDHV